MKDLLREYIKDVVSEIHVDKEMVNLVKNIHSAKNSVRGVNIKALEDVWDLKDYQRTVDEALENLTKMGKHVDRSNLTRELASLLSAKFGLYPNPATEEAKRIADIVLKNNATGRGRSKR